MSTPPDIPVLKAAMAAATLQEFVKICAAAGPEVIHEELSEMDKYRVTLEERLGEMGATMEELYEVKMERDEAKKETAALQQQLIEALRANTQQPRHQQRFNSVHVEPFDGTTGKLKPFLFNMAAKLMAEGDVYADSQAQLRCYITHLTGKARSQVDNYVDEYGQVNFHGVADLITVLKSAFGDIDERGTAQRKIMKLTQGNRNLIEFLAEWQAIAAKTKFGDETLCFVLRQAIHPTLLRRLTLSPIDDAISWTQLIDLVRQADVIERRLDPQYYTKGKNSNSGPTLPTQTQQNHTHDDPMDLSAARTEDLSANKIDVNQIGWGKKDHGRKPVTDDEKEAKRIYCFVMKLCNWCYSKDHKGAFCPQAFWNKGKSFYTGSKGKKDKEQKEGNESS